MLKACAFFCRYTRTRTRTRTRTHARTNEIIYYLCKIYLFISVLFRYTKKAYRQKKQTHAQRNKCKPKESTR